MAGGREQMIDAAERIGAERGLGAMSLREVQAAAGQRNKSAAQYHFGSRAGLVEAVIAARMGPINQRRHELLEAHVGEPNVRSVVEALVLPLADATVGQSSSHWARFLFQGWADPTVADAVRRSFSASSYRQVRDLLEELLAHLPEPLRTRRIDRAVGLVVMALAAAEDAADGRGERLDPAVTAATLVDECCGLLEAPLSSGTAAALERTSARTG